MLKLDIKKYVNAGFIGFYNFEIKDSYLKQIDFRKNYTGETVFEYFGIWNLEELIKILPEPYQLLMLFHIDELRKL